MKPPLSDAQSVEPGRLMAGEYLGAKVDADAVHRLMVSETSALRPSVDLTEETDGLSPYSHLLAEGVRWARDASR
jgi:hypothetical protein